jgi:hypothetical protein
VFLCLVVVRERERERERNNNKRWHLKTNSSMEINRRIFKTPRNVKGLDPKFISLRDKIKIITNFKGVNCNLIKQ